MTQTLAQKKALGLVHQTPAEPPVSDNTSILAALKIINTSVSSVSSSLSTLSQSVTSIGNSLGDLSDEFDQTKTNVSSVSSGLSDLSDELIDQMESISSVSSGLANIYIVPPSGADFIDINVPAGDSIQIDPAVHVVKGTLKIDPESVRFQITTEGQTVSLDGKTLTCTKDNGSHVILSADHDTGVITITQSGAVVQLGYMPSYSIADMDGNTVSGNIYMTITE